MLEVKWQPTADDLDRFRIHYADPETGFDWGWNRDEDHPDLGPAHFQYREAGDEEPIREPARFSHRTPVGILWEWLDCLEAVLAER